MGMDIHTQMWEKRMKQNTAVRHGRVHPHAQGTRAWAEYQIRPNLKNRKTHEQKLGHTGVSHGRVPQNPYIPLTIHHPLPLNP
ncbi:hypothetical protein GOBAR_AA18562 [Gossypium barbadense]|uniref:Uncharacterized protein n=1 Tax=Gossypium barbadense TaxID=3634 RepID=A0A2P5XFK9_GOSBA|nr:hypothetical protein GOBAR_AA18562 [Gossypium barbadense]